MCLAYPGKVIKVVGQKATIHYPSEDRDVLTGGYSINVGDYVLVQMGIITKIISTEENKQIISAWKSLSK